jgi:carboxypeptidase Q
MISTARKYLIVILCIISMGFANSVFAQSPAKDSIFLRKIYDVALTKGSAYTNLYTLCKKAPARLSGSANAAKAVDLTYNMLQLIADTAWLQETMVPHWERGEKEVGYLKAGGKKIPMKICALGGSVATPEKGMTAQVIMVESIDELKGLEPSLVKGKIVFINQAMDPKFIDTFSAYGGCAGIRVRGADEAAEKGAVAVLIRSLTLRNDDFPHTGLMIYKGENKIPAAALSTNDANKLQEYLGNYTDLPFYLKMSCKNFPDEKSYNVIGEIKGSEYPNEIILIGGHLDSWDNGEGAHDDGAGCVQAMEVLHIFKELGIQPKRTIRCVLFMNEENGAKGADTYALQAKNNKEKHLVAIESDRGGFTPRGFSAEGNEPIITQCMSKLEAWKHLFLPYLVHYFVRGGSGVDVSRLKDQNVALLGLIPDSQRYFDVHHAADDTFENVNKRELEMGAGTVTALVWLFSEYGLN